MKRFCILAALLLLLPLRPALAWEEPCIGQPYDYSYADERRMIAVNRMEEPSLTYFVADVQLAEGSLWQSVCSDTMRPLTQLLAGTDAVLAINGDDYGAHNYGVIIRNGELLRDRDTTRHMLTVDGDGTLRLLTDRKHHPANALAEQRWRRTSGRRMNSAPRWWRTGRRYSSFSWIMARRRPSIWTAAAPRSCGSWGRSLISPVAGMSGAFPTGSSSEEADHAERVDRRMPGRHPGRGGESAAEPAGVLLPQAGVLCAVPCILA
ncbi:MAG: hypothetical protein SOY30_04700 [Eubacteriales bacterium]|nr:hypothetical protein [Eubacteriales bacterium]